MYQDYLNKLSKDKTLFIGIDPDKVKSGVALYQQGHNYCLCHLDMLDFVELCDKVVGFDTKFLVSAGWLNKKSNFRQTGNTLVDQKIAESVGRNHEVGEQLVAILKRKGIKYVLGRPRGKKTKDKELVRMITGHTGKLDQELIDAAIIVVEYVNRIVDGSNSYK